MLNVLYLDMNNNRKNYTCFERSYTHYNKSSTVKPLNSGHLVTKMLSDVQKFPIFIRGKFLKFRKDKCVFLYYGKNMV